MSLRPVEPTPVERFVLANIFSLISVLVAGVTAVVWLSGEVHDMSWMNATWAVALFYPPVGAAIALYRKEPLRWIAVATLIVWAALIIVLVCAWVFVVLLLKNLVG